MHFTWEQLIREQLADRIKYLENIIEQNREYITKLQKDNERLRKLDNTVILMNY